jgi:predicted DNA-binding protein
VIQLYIIYINGVRHLGVTERHKLNNYVRTDLYERLKSLSEDTNKSMGFYLDKALDLYFGKYMEDALTFKEEVKQEIIEDIKVYIDVKLKEINK